MPQPTITGSGIFFGNNAAPAGQGTLPWLNLNDLASWYVQDFSLDEAFRAIQSAPVLYRGKGVYLSDDFGPRQLKVPYWYSEATQTLGAATAALSMAGEQYLTFDNKVTAILVRYQGVANRALVRRWSPLQWKFDLLFYARSPWFADIAATTFAAQALNSGSATNFTVTYAGSVWCEPVWTLTIPNTNTAVIQSFVLKNTVSLEQLTINFQNNGGGGATGLAGSTTWTLTIDSSAMSVKDQNGTFYDISGSFPLLYSSAQIAASEANAMTATLTPASGTATGCTIGASYNNRWLI